MGVGGGWGHPGLLFHKQKVHPGVALHGIVKPKHWVFLLFLDATSLQ